MGVVGCGQWSCVLAHRDRSGCLSHPTVRSVAAHPRSRGKIEWVMGSLAMVPTRNHGNECVVTGESDSVRAREVSFDLADQLGFGIGLD